MRSGGILTTMRNPNLTLEDAIRDDMIAELVSDSAPDIEELFSRYSGEKLANMVIGRVQRDVATNGPRNLVRTETPEMKGHVFETMYEVISRILQRWVPAFITDTHREFIVRCHAHGLSTAEAVSELICEDSPLEILSQPDAVGFKQLKSVLVTRLAYLKPGTARWPQKKYGELWRKERQQHKMALCDIPLTSSSEQAVLLAKHAGRLNDLLEHDEHSAADWQLLTNSLVKTLDSLRKVSAIQQQAPTNLSGPQLVAVLQRLTLALDTPEQLALSTDTDTLIGVLEQLTLALKSPEHKAIDTKAEIMSADTNTNNGNPA